MQNFGRRSCLAHVSLLTRPLATVAHVSLGLDSVWMGLQVTEIHISVYSYFSPNPASFRVQQFSGQGLDRR